MTFKGKAGICISRDLQ